MTAKTIRNAVPADAPRCFEIESTAYEGDEGATLDRITRRTVEYPQGFLILEVEGRIAGYINSACAHAVEMSEDSFKELVGHDPAAPNAVILSVTVDPAHQGNGYSIALMEEFVARMKALDKKTIHLMCKDRHVPLYERFGYRYSQLSASRHGGFEWHEMVMEL